MAKLMRAARAWVGGLMFVATTAHAGWTCSGKVTELTLDPGGNVYMSLVKTDGGYAWQWKQLCNLRADSNGVVAQACKSIYAQLVTSIALDRTVTFWFDYANTSTPDCSPARFQPWSALATDSGSTWYFGPKLD